LLHKLFALGTLIALSLGVNRETTHNNELPDFFWAACILAVLNLCLLVWFSISPDQRLEVNKRASSIVYAAGMKPSPFEQVVDLSKRKRKAAVKIAPVAAPSFAAYLQAPTSD
jgi:hypothetical protein